MPKESDPVGQACAGLGSQPDASRPSSTSRSAELARRDAFRPLMLRLV